ncbi:MAG: hypothetical protein ABIQ30_01550 [Devosia sp.]
MTTAFADPTPRWVPFATAGAIVALVWGTSVWQNLEFGFSTKFAAGLAVFLLVLIMLQGRLFWRDSVALVTAEGQRFEAYTSTWVGAGRHVSFAPHETANWVAKPKSGTKELSSVSFVANGVKLELSFLSPKLVDLDTLSLMQPIFFAGLKRDYPGLKSLSAAA